MLYIKQMDNHSAKRLFPMRMAFVNNGIHSLHGGSNASSRLLLYSSAIKS